MLKHRVLPVAATTALLPASTEPILTEAADADATSVISIEQAGDIAMSQHAKVATLKVLGATIYYETQGSGPMLLIIPGGPQDAGVFAGLSALLADRHTVVGYDPRGNSRSTFDGEAEPLQVDVQADDAAALIEVLAGGEPAYVFGTSGGAQIGLNLAARYPHLVRALVAHEPPTTMLLDDPSAALATNQHLYDTYKRDGVEAAMRKFFADNGFDGGAGEGDAPPEFEMSSEEMETFGRVSGNFEYWLAHGMMPLSLYEPDIATLRTGSPRIIVAIGEGSNGQPIAEMGNALASKLGIAPTPFPGDHMGFEAHAGDFAEMLHKTLSSN